MEKKEKGKRRRKKIKDDGQVDGGGIWRNNVREIACNPRTMRG